LLYRVPRDLDISVNSMSLENFYSIGDEIFIKLKNLGIYKDNNEEFKKPFLIRDYGFMRFTVYGITLDLMMLCSDRNVISPLVQIKFYIKN
jgi:hypothetical protein